MGTQGQQQAETVCQVAKTLPKTTEKTVERTNQTAATIQIFDHS